MLRPFGTALAALAAVLTLACRDAAAQTEPFKITGGGVVNYIPVTVGDPVFHSSAGTATHLGKYSGGGEVELLGFTSPTTAAFASAVPNVFTAADGDKLAFHYGRTDFGAAAPGLVELIYVGNGEFITVWVAEFTPVPSASTGRFANVIGGSFVMVAVTEPFVLGAKDPVAYTWSGQGTIEFGKK